MSGSFEYDPSVVPEEGATPYVPTNVGHREEKVAASKTKREAAVAADPRDTPINDPVMRLSESEIEMWKHLGFENIGSFFPKNKLDKNFLMAIIIKEAYKFHNTTRSSPEIYDYFLKNLNHLVQSFIKIKSYPEYGQIEEDELMKKMEQMQRQPRGGSISRKGRKVRRSRKTSRKVRRSRKTSRKVRRSRRKSRK